MKNKNQTTTPSSLFPRLNFAPLTWPYFSGGSEEGGIWCWESAHNSFLLPFLSPHAFPLFQYALLHGLQLPSKHVFLFQHGVLHGLHGNMFFTSVLFTDWWESLLWPLEQLLPLFFLSAWCPQDSLSHFCPHSSMSWNVLPFLISVFPEVSPSLLGSSAVPWGGSVGDGWNQLGRWGTTPSLSLEMPPQQPLPADAWAPAPDSFMVSQVPLANKTCQFYQLLYCFSWNTVEQCFYSFIQT